jgi:16S rRNA (uracil1498-N3)-methyltransferase
MSTIRCFINESTKLLPGSKHLLSNQESHHLVNVLRAKPSDSLLLMNGHGDVANVHVCGKIGTQVEVQVKAITVCQRSRLVLCQAMLKSKAMDLVIRDATAIGVAKILPLISERIDVKFDKKSIENKLLHWKAIAIEACKQSGEAFIPEICNPIAFEDFLNTNKETSIVASLYNQEKKYITDYHSEICSAEILNLIVGPEGDFSRREYEMMMSSGMKFITLTKNVLRSETAALYLLSLADQIMARG